MTSKTAKKVPEYGERGFAAVIAVVLLSTAMLAFSLVTASAAASYADSVLAREKRIQASLNLRACLDSASLMLAKDYFLNGTTSIAEFGCDLSVVNPLNGVVSIQAVAAIEGVKAYGSRTLNVAAHSVTVTADLAG